MTKVKTRYMVLTRAVTIHAPTGGRIRNRLAGRWRMWRGRKTLEGNVRAAINHVANKLMRDKMGGIVAIHQTVNGTMEPGYTKIFQAKWGSNNRPFLRFDGPVGHYWAQKMAPEFMNRMKRVMAAPK